MTAALVALWQEKGGAVGVAIQDNGKWTAWWSAADQDPAFAVGATEQEASDALIRSLAVRWSDTRAALLDVLADLSDLTLSDCYGIEADCEAPLDVALFAWRRAGCPR